MSNNNTFMNRTLRNHNLGRGGNGTRPFPAWVLIVSLWVATDVTAAPRPDDATELLRQRLEELAVADNGSMNGIEFAAPLVLQNFYQARAFSLAWNERTARALAALVGDAPDDGLDPADYLQPKLNALPELNTLPWTARVDADLLLTEAFLRLAYHHRFGKVDPKSIETTWNYARNVSPDGPFNALERVLHADDFAAQFMQEIGHGPVYESLRALLARYRSFAASGGWEVIQAGATLRPNDVDPRVPALRRRLAAEGYASSVAPGAPDNRLDPALVSAISSFQQTHGLDADGTVGKGTLAALNVPVADRIEQIRLNLERLRWVLVDRPARFIAVNIAGFRVYYVDAGQAKWSARVVVGKPYRATPIFRADMKYLVLNPDWTVPPTILRKDVLPALQRDPAYLADHQMDVVDAKGQTIDSATIDWTLYARGSFPYQIRQRPGPTNSLGRIKFIFPNPYFVFLHDTTARNLFDQPERTFSSGCIRVEHPLELAELLLQSKPGWDHNAIEAAVATNVTRTVLLDEPMPVMLMYLTAIAFDDGRNFAFYRDVYQRDKQLLAALDAGFTYVPPAGMMGAGE
jgi:murein L,D-transpeptidase YcbB/YkuD